MLIFGMLDLMIGAGATIGVAAGIAVLAKKKKNPPQENAVEIELPIPDTPKKDVDWKHTLEKVVPAIGL